MPEASPAGPVAAVDCGTNSTRLLVCDAEGEPLARRVTITRLGQGVDASKRLAPEAVARTVGVLQDYRAEMERLGVTAGRQVATSALRDAANGEDFLRRASASTGLTTEVLSGLEEARLSFAGATAELGDRGATAYVVVDIGGGSTELAVGSDRQVEAVSLDIGCVRLTERYLHDDPPTPAQLLAARAAVDDALGEAEVAVPALRARPPRRRLLGLAGTVSALARLEQGLAVYDRSRVHHFVLRRPVVAAWLARLAAEPASARLEHPGLSAGREDVVVGGVVVLLAVMERLGFEACVASEADILDGLVASLLGKLP